MFSNNSASYSCSSSISSVSDDEDTGEGDRSGSYKIKTIFSLHSTHLKRNFIPDRDACTRIELRINDRAITDLLCYTYDAYMRHSFEKGRYQATGICTG